MCLKPGNNTQLTNGLRYIKHLPWQRHNCTMQPAYDKVATGGKYTRSVIRLLHHRDLTSCKKHMLLNFLKEIGLWRLEGSAQHLQNKNNVPKTKQVKTHPKTNHRTTSHQQGIGYQPSARNLRHNNRGCPCRHAKQRGSTCLLGDEQRHHKVLTLSPTRKRNRKCGKGGVTLNKYSLLTSHVLYV